MIKLSVCLIGIVSLVTACNTPRYVYSPPAQNVPLLTEKNDSKLGILYSSNAGGDEEIFNYSKAKSNGLDVHAAYAVSNHLALQFNYFHRKELNGDALGNTPSLIKYNRNLTEGGIGYYTAVNNKKNLFFQAFAGAGAGKFSFKDFKLNGANYEYRNFHQADVTKIFLQPAIMYRNEKMMGLALSSRFSFVNYHNIKTDYDSSELALYELTSLKDGTVVFWEPSMVYAQGLNKFPYLRLELQMGISALLSRRFVDTRTFNVSVGLQADIANLIKKKPAKKD